MPNMPSGFDPVHRDILRVLEASNCSHTPAVIRNSIAFRPSLGVESVYRRLVTMERHGLVARNGGWTITPSGADLVRAEGVA